MSDCWSDDDIEAAARTGGSDVSPHIAACAHCRERLVSARDDLALLSELRMSRPHGSVTASSGDTLVFGYRIHHEIHRGGQGIVYRAEQIANRRPVALKILLSGRDSTPRERRRFEREIELASRLDHANIVTPYDSGVANGTPWCAMELVDGMRLDEWARHTHPTTHAKIELVRRIAAAVAHAHQRGVIHRDLKPANVLVDAAGNPHVLDFGTALAAADSVTRLRITAPGEFLGTLAYAAPEQLRGATLSIDTRTDVYALGAILYELLTGRLPCDTSTSVAELVERITTHIPPAASTLVPDVGSDLDAILAKALAKEPADRYGSAESFARDLAHYLADEPVEARRASFGYVLRKHLGRRRKRILAAVGLALVGVALAAAWIREHRRAERQSEQAALVRSIIQDLLVQASPQHMGGDARILDVYEVLARDLDEALRDAPDVQAEVELTIGDTYRRLLRASEAEPHLRRALDRFREIDDARGLQVARATNALALALAATHEKEAVEHATAALTVRERHLADSDPLVAESRRTLAIAHMEQFTEPDFASVQDLLERALLHFRAHFGEAHPEVAETELWLARASEDVPRAGREVLLARALATLERPGSKDPRALDALTSYATLLQEQRRFDEARALLDRAGVLAHDLFGDALASDMLRRCARLEYARGNMRNAELLTRQAVARELDGWAKKRGEIGASLRALARRVEQPGPPAAEPPYAEAFAALRALEGDGAFELAQWMNGIAVVLHELGRGAATEPMLREALRIRCRAMGADCPVRRQSIELLASELAGQERGGEVVPLLEEALATYERIGEEETQPAVRTRELLVACKAQKSATEPR